MIANGSFTDPTVLVACIGAVGSLAAILLASLLSQRNQSALRKETTAQSQQMKEIHYLVNSRLEEALIRIAALEGRLGLAPGEELG